MFYNGFNKVFGIATDGYVSTCRLLIRRSAVSLLLLLGMTVFTGFLGKQIPASFLPEEDQGYMYAGVQLPDAASLQRTDADHEAGRGDSEQDAGGEILLVHRRLQHAEPGAEHLQRLFLHHPGGLGESARNPRRSTKPSWRT